ncbi:hypothetical protein [Streptococcus cuniculipharyngis]|uniref:Uncharacterized protein n=1 Tax=Streptococcus cuniculipharyngis TaxID=1562651 RepID=A0A5C5SDJ0_9STRE|nr:hypothetical protein [Streptococcus cuniculipharyngis]TWS99167.1 hypothetical protein FRX57_02935 [Streptococcus cuniculipharyngis]
MENFQFWLTLATATIPATITGLLSFFASWMKNRSEIKQIEKNHQNDLEKLEKQYKHDFEAIEKNHSQEIEKMKEAHKLQLENIQKQSELDMAKDIFGTLMNAATPAFQEAISEEVRNQRRQNQKDSKK